MLTSKSIVQLRVCIQQLAYAQLSPLYPLHHLHDRLFQAFSHFYCKVGRTWKLSYFYPGLDQEIFVVKSSLALIPGSPLTLIKMEGESLVAIHT